MKVTWVFFILFSIFILIIPETSANSIVEENLNNTETLLPVRRKRYEYLWFCVEIQVHGEGLFKIERADLVWGKWIRQPDSSSSDADSPAGLYLTENSGRKRICSSGSANVPSGTEVKLEITSHNTRRPWILKWDRPYAYTPEKYIEWENYDHEGMFVSYIEHGKYWYEFSVSNRYHRSNSGNSFKILSNT